MKDKLGVRAVPSGEVEFEGALAYVVGDPTKGILLYDGSIEFIANLQCGCFAWNNAQGFERGKNVCGKTNAFGKS